MNKVDDLLIKEFEEAWKKQIDRLSQKKKKLVMDNTNTDEKLQIRRFEYENGVIAEEEKWDKSRDAEYFDTAYNHYLYDEKGRCILDEKLFQKVYYPDSNQVEFYWDDKSFKHFTKSGEEDTEKYYIELKVIKGQEDRDNLGQDVIYNNSLLAKLRKKIAHNIDETLGTNLEEKKLAKPLKKIEKAVSDKLLGKVKE